MRLILLVFDKDTQNVFMTSEHGMFPIVKPCNFPDSKESVCNKILNGVCTTTTTLFVRKEEVTDYRYTQWGTVVMCVRVDPDTFKDRGRWIPVQQALTSSYASGCGDIRLFLEQALLRLRRYDNEG